MASPVSIDQEIRIADTCPLDNTAGSLDLLDEDARTLLEEEALLRELREDPAARDAAVCAHVWPDELEAATQCLHCSLAYQAWTTQC